MEVRLKCELRHQYPNGKNEKSYPYGKSDKIFHTDQLFLYSEVVPAGRRASAPHRHTATDEIIYIIKGELLAFEGDQSVLLKAGDSVCFKQRSQDNHYLENQSNEDSEFLIFRRSTKKEDVIF